MYCKSGIDNGGTTFGPRRGFPLKISWIEKAWYFGMYMLGAGARADAMAMGLQAIWNRDNVPAWNSDYHLDTNLQQNYWPAYVTGHLNLCLPLYKLLADDWHEGSKILADYHGTRGVKLPLAAGPDGMSLAGFLGRRGLA